ncbi:ABC transporter permease [Compostibacter hankyongensis]|uniref:ABC transporter permease n=1 Tax=Compostibacter hankyongensis TaxID=1007089 RepID=A0ABP8FC92_9BACT
MILHYLKIAWRNMRKQRMYAVVNIIGFAIGIAACMLIALYVGNELSYDRDNPNKDRIFRVVGEFKLDGEIQSGLGFPAPMAKALQNDFPEVEKAGRIMSNQLFGGANNQIRREDQADNTYETGFCFADTTMLDMLNVRMIYGDRTHALSEPYSVVLCKSMADKYFPHQNPVGKTMIFNDQIPVMVGGVMQDFPPNSHLQYRGFISLSGMSFGDNEQQNWVQSNYVIYLQLKPHVDIDVFNKKITTDIIDKYIIPARKAAGRKNVEKVWKKVSLYLQPLSDIHLHSYNIEDGSVKYGDIRFVYLFVAIAVFILVLACINFLNMATARSANRAKEVGLRKVVGSSRGGLIRQFLAESMLYSFLSFLIAIVISVFTLPWFSRVAGVALSMPWHTWWFMPSLVAAVFVTGLIAGLYPAFYLSGFKPVSTLKGNLALGSRNTGLRSTLVVFQFTISIILLIGTMIIYRQMQYILNSNAGFNKDQVMLIEGADALRNQTLSFKNELQKLPVVKHISVSDFIPVSSTGSKRNGNTFWEEGKDESTIVGQRWVVDENYVSTFGMHIIAGRNFSPSMKTDSSGAVINKAFAQQLGGGDVIGKRITNGGMHMTVIGVVDNFYFESLKQRVDPLCMVLGNSNSIISVKINAANTKAAIAAFEKVWKGFLPHQQMRYDFLDQSYATMYADVQRMQYIFTGFAILAVIVACLGLFALAAFMAEQRSKEISIRKVLGASGAHLFSLLTGNFLRLILISLCIAAPVAWLLMNKWLQDYAYRIRITWDVFALAGVMVFAVAIITICWQAIRAVVSNPVTALRGE